MKQISACWSRMWRNSSVVLAPKVLYGHLLFEVAFRHPSLPLAGIHDRGHRRMLLALLMHPAPASEALVKGGRSPEVVSGGSTFKLSRCRSHQICIEFVSKSGYG